MDAHTPTRYDPRTFKALTFHDATSAFADGSDTPRDYLERVQNAGSVFLGPWTPESVGDYCSGTNHVLPTYGYARSYSGLSLAAFQKQISVQELTYAGLKTLEPTVTTLAGLEGLDAHAQAVLVRIEDEEGKQSP